MKQHSVIRTTYLAVAVAATGILASCGGGDAEVAQADAAPADVAAPDAEYGLVSPEEAAALAADGITVIDVRTPEEFAEGHIDGAEMIDFYTDSFVDDIAALDPDQEYLLYCRSGNRSGQTFALMQELGFEQVYDMDGGMNAYQAEGLPLAP